MHLLLYMVAIFCVLISGSAVYMGEPLSMLAFGSLAAILFGVMGKVCHTLDSIDSHLSKMSSMRVRRVSGAFDAPTEEFPVCDPRRRTGGDSEERQTTGSH